MKNLCNNCGKCSDELDSFGYCPKCSKKLFGQSKHTTVEQVRIKNKIKVFSVLVIILICISVAIYYRNNILEFIALSTETTSSNTISNTVQAVINTEDKILTAENYKSLSEEYSNNNKDSDNLYYYTYACMYYMVKDGLSSATLSEEQQQEAMYSRIYGKTINQLISEGKKLMADNNTTVNDYKQTLKSSTAN